MNCSWKGLLALLCYIIFIKWKNGLKTTLTIISFIAIVSGIICRPTKLFVINCYRDRPTCSTIFVAGFEPEVLWSVVALLAGAYGNVICLQASAWARGTACISLEPKWGRKIRTRCTALKRYPRLHRSTYLVCDVKGQPGDGPMAASWRRHIATYRSEDKHTSLNEAIPSHSWHTGTKTVVQLNVPRLSRACRRADCPCLPTPITHLQQHPCRRPQGRQQPRSKG